MKRASFLALLLLLCFASVCVAEKKATPKTKKVKKGMEVVASDSPLEAKGNRFAFLVAVSDYAEVSSLHCTVNDVNAIRDQLLKMGFAKENIRMLTSEERVAYHPTKRNIERYFTELLKKVKSGDWVFVYLSGHGTQITGKSGSYFCPEEVDLKNLENTTVSIDGMMKQLSDSPASFRWMIVDACRDENSSKSAFGQKSLQEVSNPPANVSLIQSCQPGDYSYEGGNGTARDIKNGFFTISLLESFTLTADADKDGKITFSEMFKHITKRTDELAHLHYQKEQIPMLTGQVTDFVLLTDLNLVKANELAKEAEALIEKDQFKEAKAKIDEALKLAPNNKQYKLQAKLIERALVSKSVTPSKPVTPILVELPGLEETPAQAQTQTQPPKSETTLRKSKSEYSREVLDKTLTDFIASLGELPVEVKNAEEPLKILYYFTQAMAKDQQSVVLALLSEKALKERLSHGKSFGPTAKSMKNTDVILGSVQYLNDDKGTPVGAHVRTTWRPKGASDEKGEQIAWVLRREANTWRVAGMISVVAAAFTQKVVNFENLDETAKQYAALVRLIQEHSKNSESNTGR